MCISKQQGYRNQYQKRRIAKLKTKIDNKITNFTPKDSLKKSEGTESAKKRRSIFNGKTLIVGDSNQKSAR